jgi:hypothetical protein
MNSKIIIRVCAATITLTFIACWIAFRSSPAPSEPAFSSQKANEVLIAPPSTVKEDSRRTNQEVIDQMNREISAQGGALQVWKNQLNAVQSEAKQIRNIKLNSKNKLFFEKVEKFLYEWDPLVDVEDAEIASFLEAKQACVVFTKRYSLPTPSKAANHNGISFFAPPSTAKLLPSRIHPKGVEISIPDNFSQGWAIKMSEKKRIILYRWNFNELPPEDGIVGIETEWE